MRVPHAAARSELPEESRAGEHVDHDGEEKSREKLPFDKLRAGKLQAASCKRSAMNCSTSLGTGRLAFDRLRAGRAGRMHGERREERSDHGLHG